MVNYETIMYDTHAIFNFDKTPTKKTLNFLKSIGVRYYYGLNSCTIKGMDKVNEFIKFLEEYKKRSDKLKDTAYKGETLCWRCVKACGKCSWSHNFTPVDGWVAKPRRMLLHLGDGGSLESAKYCQSYRVISCPEFVKG